MLLTSCTKKVCFYTRSGGVRNLRKGTVRKPYNMGTVLGRKLKINSNINNGRWQKEKYWCDVEWRIITGSNCFVSTWWWNDLVHERIWFELDGDPAHYAPNIRFLNEIFPNRWIGRWVPNVSRFNPTGLLFVGFLEKYGLCESVRQHWRISSSVNPGSNRLLSRWEWWSLWATLVNIFFT